MQYRGSLGRELGQGREISKDGSVAGMERFSLCRMPVALTRGSANVPSGNVHT